MALVLWLLVIIVIFACTIGFWGFLAFVLMEIAGAFIGMLLEDLGEDENGNIKHWKWYILRPLAGIAAGILVSVPFAIVMLGWDGFVEDFLGGFLGIKI